MSKYDKDTKFYWLQLKEDFFESDSIEWLEEQEPNGRDYAYFYLKLCLKSLKTNGILIRNVGNILIPYDYKKLAELTKMDFDTVCVAMDLLQKIGLVEVLDNGEIYITQLENLIGSKSLGALKKQQQRQLRGQKADKCPPEIEIKLKDKDKTKDKDKIIYSSKKIENEFEEIWKLYPKKQGKTNALKYYKKAIEKGVEKETIINGLNNYINYIKIEKIDSQYIKNGSTWFYQQCWNDDYTIKRKMTTKDLDIDISDF